VLISGSRCQDDGQLVIVDPSLGPGDAWLHCCEPGVAQYDWVSSQMNEKESHLLYLGTSSDGKICVMSDGSLAVGCLIDVEYFSRFD
jgi:hypothetical protein